MKFIYILVLAVCFGAFVLVRFDNNVLLAAHPGEHQAVGSSLMANTSAEPDLTITSIRFTPPNPGAGATADIAVVVKNIGAAPTSSGFNLYLYVEPVDNPPTQSTPHTARFGYSLPLPAGGVFTYTRTGQVFTVNNPKVYAWVDPPWENKVVEANEDNNLFPQPSAGVPDAYENDNSCTTASALNTDGTEQSRNLSRTPNADVDWIKFTASGGVTYVAWAISVGADADLEFELHYRCDGPPTFGPGGKIEFTPAVDGTYYLKVAHTQPDYGPDTAYRLKITSNSGCTAYFEPNNTCSQSGDLMIGPAQTHSFCDAGDADWMHFPVVAGAEYKVTTTNLGPNAQVQMWLYQSCSDVNNTASGATLAFTAPSAGFAYLRMENQDPNLHGAGTDYSVQVDRIGNEGCNEDIFEQDDNPDGAQRALINSEPQVRNICPAGDEDWVKFEAVAGTTYNLETFDLAKAGDTILCLYDLQGNRLACDEDSGAGKGSRLLWQAPTSGPYRLRIADHNPAVAGPDTQYKFTISSSLCSDDQQEPDNAQTTARVINTDGVLHPHNICPAGDGDWSAFSAIANTPYLIETHDLGAEADTVIELYDASGQRLEQNDDYSPGIGSALAYTFSRTGTYFVKVRLYNPTYFGRGTEYTLQIQPGTATPPPIPTYEPPPTPTLTPTPQPSAIRTLILVNRARLAELHGEVATSNLMTKLAILANHHQVQGEVIQLENNTAVNAAYTVWLADWLNVEKANQVAAAIRNLIMTFVEQHNGVAYVVLVGDDRALPFRRILDNTDQYPEKTYTRTDDNHPTGAAQKANYFLSNDYYGSRVPTPFRGRELYLPDLAIGRLIETPEEMIRSIDSFLANPVTVPENILVSGYDFVQDLAQTDCDGWKEYLGQNRVDCSLIGNGWSSDDLRRLQLRTNAPFQIQSISGHASHFEEGAPQGVPIQAHEIANALINLNGGLIYTPGCHSGLNVPPGNKLSDLDLPQAFIRKGANYVGNTGYGWGLSNSIGLSEKLIQLFTEQLRTSTTTGMGSSLAKAKQRYYAQSHNLTAYDEKILQELTFYGLPMQQLQTSSPLGEQNDFPGVDFVPRLPLGGDGVISGTVPIDFRKALNSPEWFTLAESASGDYFALDQSIHTAPGDPIQPLHFGDITSIHPARSAIIRTASFTTRSDFNIALAAPYNEYVAAAVSASVMTTPTLPNPLAWYPPVLSMVQSYGGKSNLITQIGQFQPASRQLRIFEQMQVDLIYSNSTDQTGPEILVIDSIYHPDTDGVEVKVGAIDPTGIAQVVLSYIRDTKQLSNTIQSLDLHFDATVQKWIGSFKGNEQSRYFVQIMDNAGNVTVANNKGEYYRPGFAPVDEPPIACGKNCTFLPIIVR